MLKNRLIIKVQDWDSALQDFPAALQEHLVVKQFP
jgi:hypothetical protein